MNEKKMVGKRSVLFSRPPIIIGAGSVAGEKEGNGAFGKCFDMVEEDPLFGGKTWEEAESKMQQLATRIALRKAGLEPQEIRYLVAGDLLGQLIATSFGIMNFNIPMFGVYGACSTMGESLAIGAMLVDGEFADYVVALTSSHFKDMGIGPDYYDCIVTGDLGTIGQRILIDMLRGYGYDIEKQHFDCGTEIYYNKEQGTNAGGSGCGCSAITLCGYILQKMKKKEWKRVLFVPTGALLSTVSFNEGNSIPGIAHAVMLEGISGSGKGVGEWTM